MDKLYRLLQEYECKDLDDKFIEDSFSIMMEREKDLGHYITNFRMEEIGYGSASGYSRETGEIIVDNKLLQQQQERFFNISKVVVLKVLRQSIEHARNLKTTLEGSDRIEPIVLRCANRDFLVAHGFVTPLFNEEKDPLFIRSDKILNYETDPDRRTSEIRAWKYIVNTLKNNACIEQHYSRLMLAEAYKKGYKDNGYYLDPPTYQFLVGMGLNRDLKLIKKRMEFKHYSFDTRIELGLPISYEEKSRGIKRKTLTNGFIM